MRKTCISLRPTAALFLSDKNRSKPATAMAIPASNIDPKLPRYRSPLKGMPLSWQPPQFPFWLWFGDERRLQTGSVESLQNLLKFPNSVSPIVTTDAGDLAQLRIHWAITIGVTDRRRVVRVCNGGIRRGCNAISSAIRACFLGGFEQKRRDVAGGLMVCLTTTKSR